MSSPSAEAQSFKLSFKGVANDVVDIGKYRCILSGVKFEAASQSSGKPYIRADFTVRSAADDETDVKFAGRKLFRNFSLQPQSLFALKQALKALGADDELFDSDEDVDIVAYMKEELVGNECNVNVTHEDYQGETRARVGRLESAAFGGF